MFPTIGKYRVDAELGRGGFCTVYRAHDPAVGRPVALKMLRDAHGGDVLERFQSEIGITGNLTHKNIVTVYESGTDHGLPYMVMELLGGRTLQDSLTSGVTLSLYDKIHVMIQVAEGLKFAHDHNIVHRDVKPGNVMMMADGTVKIIDFGISRFTTESRQKQQPVGTIPYMAPEQFEGNGEDQANAQTDIFAYGVMFYELLTGKHPFNSDDNVLGIIERIKWMEPEAITNLFPECPGPLAQLICRAIEKDPEVRYSNFTDILLDLKAVLADIAQERAALILQYVPSFIEAGNLDAAESMLKGVATLDPGNLCARRFRRTIQEDRRLRLTSAGLAVSDRAYTVVSAAGA